MHAHLGALNIIGGSQESRNRLSIEQQKIRDRVQNAIERLGVENDGKGWHAKVFLYCTETLCPQSGWMVPLLPTLIVSTSRN
jgi:putative DNA methylase